MAPTTNPNYVVLMSKSFIRIHLVSYLLTLLRIKMSGRLLLNHIFRIQYKEDM